MRLPGARLAKSTIRRYRPDLVYRGPVIELDPERLYAYLDALWQRRELDGTVLEVGCWVGGTSAVASRMLRRTGHPKRYVCVDTFSGFVPSQLENDVRHGTPREYERFFRENSVETVRQLVDRWGAPEVELVQGDIATIDAETLPERIAVCLLDVDLEIPIYEGLKRIVPRLAPGGIVLVDDCDDETTWAGARVGYRRYVEEQGLPARNFLGLGIVEAPIAAAPGAPTPSM